MVNLKKIVFAYSQDDLIQLARQDAFKRGQEMLSRVNGESLICKKTPTTIGETLEFELELGK